MAVESASIELDRRRIRDLTERETALLNERTPRSGEMFRRADAVLAGGVASSYQLREPWPIYLERGSGPNVWDVDGNEMLDCHNGFGSMVQGHAHPAIGAAISERYGRGTHFAAPTEDAVAVGEELARPWARRQGRAPGEGAAGGPPPEPQPGGAGGTRAARRVAARGGSRSSRSSAPTT